MQEPDHQYVSALVAELRNAITPALLFLEALDDPAGSPRPASEADLLRRAELRLREVELRASELAEICSQAQAQAAAVAASPR